MLPRLIFLQYTCCILFYDLYLIEYRDFQLTCPFTCVDQIKRLQKNESNIEHEFSVFWVPRRTLVSNQILEEEGVIGDVSVAEFPLYFLPLENDVLSLELPDAFSDLYLVCATR